MEIHTAIMDSLIDRIIGPTSITPGIELPALFALWDQLKVGTDPLAALDAAQRRLAERGYLLS